MNRTKLASAVGLALTAGFTQAWALTPAQVPVDTVVAGVRQGNRLYVSGATATDQILGRVFVIPVGDGGLCATGTVDVYSSVAVTSATNDLTGLGNILGASHKAVLCTASANTSQSGTPIGMIKESVGGSQNGVDPPALGLLTTAGGAPLNFLNLGTGATVAGCNTPVAYTAISNGAGVVLTQAFNLHLNCTAASLSVRQSHVGVSDVDPPLLTSSAAAVAALTYTPTVDIVFAHAATLGLYRDLQALQGLEAGCGASAVDSDANGGTPATDDNGYDDAVAGNDCDEPPNVPSLTEAQLRGILVGALTDWNLITDDAGATIPGLPATSTVYVCRRGDTSGTQATFEVVMLNQRCAAGVTPMIGPTVGACATQGNCAWVTNTYINDQVFAGSGSGDVRNCLVQHDDNATEHRAIGILSTESTPPNLNSNGPDGNNLTTGDRGWRYIGINRANPDLESVGEGNYELWVENTWNVPNNSPVNQDPSTPALDRSLIEDALQPDIAGAFGTQSVLLSLNETFRHVSGDGGILGIPGFPTAPPVPPFTRADWRTLGSVVNPATRTLGAVPNNCNPPTVLGQTTEAGGVGDEDNTGRDGADYAP